MAENNDMIYALTIAGFDGSAGAGFISDIKTMAHFGVYGQAVCTALTEQNEDEFVAPGWVLGTNRSPVGNALPKAYF